MSHNSGFRPMAVTDSHEVENTRRAEEERQRCYRQGRSVAAASIVVAAIVSFFFIRFYKPNITPDPVGGVVASDSFLFPVSPSQTSLVWLEAADQSGAVKLDWALKALILNNDTLSDKGQVPEPQTLSSFTGYCVRIDGAELVGQTPLLVISVLSQGCISPIESSTLYSLSLDATESTLSLKEERTGLNLRPFRHGVRIANFNDTVEGTVLVVSDRECHSSVGGKLTLLSSSGADMKDITFHSKQDAQCSIVLQNYGLNGTQRLLYAGEKQKINEVDTKHPFYTKELRYPNREDITDSICDTFDDYDFRLCDADTALCTLPPWGQGLTLQFLHPSGIALLGQAKISLDDATCLMSCFWWDPATQALTNVTEKYANQLCQSGMMRLSRQKAATQPELLYLVPQPLTGPRDSWFKVESVSVPIFAVNFNFFLLEPARRIVAVTPAGFSVAALTPQGVLAPFVSLYTYSS